MPLIMSQFEMFLLFNESAFLEVFLQKKFIKCFLKSHYK